MKKGLFIVLIIILVLAVTFSCKLFKAKPKSVTVWCWDPNFNGYSMKLASEIYNKTHPETTIEIVDIPENIEAKIEAGLQAGGAGLPDIALFQDHLIEKFIQNYPNSFVDLKASGVDYDQFAQYKVSIMSEKGKVYGIPFDTGSTGLYLRTDFLKQAGLNPDDYQKKMTWKEVIELGTLVKNKIGKPLIAYDTTSGDFFRLVFQSSGQQLFKEDGSLNINTDAVKATITVIKDCYEKGIFFKTEGWNNWVSAFNNGDSAGLVCAIWIIGTLKSKPENAGKWMVVPTPLLEDVDSAQNASNWGGSSWYVFNSSKNKKAAVDFLKTVWASDTPDALEFYNTILKGAGAMGTYLPSRSGSNYTASDEFFYKGQKVYADFAKWMEDVPALRYTPNYLSLRNALALALQLMYKGELKTADEVVARAEKEYNQLIGK
jgi:lactose/L-arabinose transport system substrate-binding protein